MLTEIKRATPTLYVYWTITDLCNFECSYCPSALHSGDFAKGKKPGFPSDEEIRTFLNNLVTKHAVGKFLQVCLSGGEPTIHPMYGEIVDAIKPHGIIETITNGARPLTWWQNLPALPDKVTMSLHPGFTNIDKVNSLGEYLLDNECAVQFNMMCDPDQWEEVQALYNKLTDRLKACVNGKLLTEHSGLSTDGTPYAYTAEQLDYISSKKSNSSKVEQKFSDVDRRVFIVEDGTERVMTHPFELINANKNKMKGWHCSAGKEGIAIHFNGKVYVGNCRIAELGRLDSFELLDQDVICPRQYCKTAADIQLPKKHYELKN
jgi:organic radical activating enzyme